MRARAVTESREKKYIRPIENFRTVRNPNGRKIMIDPFWLYFEMFQNFIFQVR